MPSLNSLRDRTSPSYGREDALQDAAVESLEAEVAGGTPLTEDELRDRAQTLLRSADRIARRRQQQHAQMRIDKVHEAGARRTPVDPEREYDHEYVPEPPKVPTPRSNDEEAAVVQRLALDEFKATLTPEARDLVERVVAGESARTIAKELGIDRETVARRLRLLAPLVQRYLVP